jgi:uncharacterized protein YkwD
MNLIDIVLILFLAYFLVMGYFQGFIRQILDFLVLIVAIILSFRLYHLIGKLLIARFAIAPSFANVAGFFIIWFIVEFFYYLAFMFFYDKIPENIRKSKLNHFSGLVPAFLRGFLIAWVLLSLILILPISSDARKQVTDSALAGKMVKNSSKIENYISQIFGGAINDTITFLTVKPEGGETLDLGYKTTDVKVDPDAEQKMLELVNLERTSRGLKPLVMDAKLQEVARAHSRDMFARGYFSHNNPDGLTPFDRMDKAGVKYTVAGENLALAPDVNIAHNGLMNSPGHKANILTPEFRKVGMGVITGGKYGEMFSQEFTD